jgi:hypothetical protein
MKNVGKWGIAGIAATGALIIGTGVASATVLSAAPAAGNYTLYGCVSGTTRTLEHVYTVASNFKTCPSGSFAVAFNSTGPKGATGATGKTGPAGPAGASAPQFRTEVDNGAEFSLTGSSSVADTSSASATYSDAGVIMPIGAASGLAKANTTYAGTVSGGAKLAENIWIGNGPEASTPGIYSLSSAADFCYGLGQDYNSSGVPASFYMTGGNCTGANGASYASQTLTLTQIATDFPAQAGAYEWVGVDTDSNTAAGTATVTSVGGQQVNETVGVTRETSGALFSYVSPKSAS